MESDAQAVITQLEKNEEDLASDGNLIEEGKGCFNQYENRFLSLLFLDVVILLLTNWMFMQ